jgi:hypothetical protein
MWCYPWATPPPGWSYGVGRWSRKCTPVSGHGTARLCTVQHVVALHRATWRGAARCYMTLHDSACHQHLLRAAWALSCGLHQGGFHKPTVTVCTLVPLPSSILHRSGWGTLRRARHRRRPVPHGPVHHALVRPRALKYQPTLEHPARSRVHVGFIVCLLAVFAGAMAPPPRSTDCVACTGSWRCDLTPV